MLSTSWNYKRKIAEDTKTLVKATLVLADGTTCELDGLDVMSGSVSFSHSTSSSGSFDIGAAVTGSFSCTLDNKTRKFDTFDFTDSRITVFIGMPYDDGSVEWLRKGTYYLEQPGSYGTTIGLTGLDSMCRLDGVMLSEAGIVFPATAGVAFGDICRACGLMPKSREFANSSYVLQQAPSNDMSCHDALSYIAQATGNFARVTNDDRLELSWYDLSAFEDEDWLDGEEFDGGNPYASGDDADGGSFANYASGAVVEGGSFSADRIVNVTAISAATVATDDVIITGVRVTAQDERTPDGTQGESGESVLHGIEGYVLEIEGNPFVSYGEARNVARNLYNQVGGMAFRPFDVSCLGDPSVEPGDPVIITDYNQRVYKSFITRCTYKMGAYAALACSAETPLRRSSASGAAITRTLQAMRDKILAEKTEREAAIEALNADLAQSSGMFTTTVRDSSGAATWYIHDKEEAPTQKPGTFTQSKFVWKVNAGGFGISIDGGKTYAYGLDKWGNAILDTIYAIGIDADYINTGSLRVRSGSKTIFCADVKAGQFWWDSQYSKMTNDGELTATRGKIGNLVLSPDALYYKTDGIDSVKAGVFISSDGVNTANGKRFASLTDGMLKVGSANKSSRSYVRAMNPRDGRDNSEEIVIGVYQDKLFLQAYDLYVQYPTGSWNHKEAEDIWYCKGFTGSIRVVDNVYMPSPGKVACQYVWLDFAKGLMVGKHHGDTLPADGGWRTLWRYEG